MRPEIALLEEVALDISFALDKIEGDAQRVRAEQALRASESRYRKLFEEATEGIVLADAETGEILDCNQAFEELSGYERRELIGKPQAMLHPPENGDPAVSISFEAHGGSMEGQVIPAEILRRTGEALVVEIKANVLEIDGRKVLQGFFRDVSETMRHQRERETTIKLLRLLNNSDDLHGMIRNLTIFLREWSGCEAVGVRLREEDDFPYFETRGFSPEFVLAERYLCARDPFGNTVRDDQGNPILDCMCGNILLGRFNPDLPFFTPRGSFWTNSTTDLLASTSEEDRQARTRNRCHGEGYESVALIPLRCGQDTLGLLQMNDGSRNRFTVGLIAFLENAADQIALALAERQAQARLEESEQRFRDVLEATGEYVWESDPAGCLTYVSHRIENILEYSPEEIVGRSPFDFMAESDARVLDVFLQERAREKSGFRDVEHLAIARSGRPVWLSATAVPVLSPTGDFMGFRGTACDITEQKRAAEERSKLEMQLHQAQKLEAIGTLAGGIAHDFNNILTPIIGYTEMALDDVPEDNPSRFDLQQVISAAGRAKDLVKQILTFSRLNQEQLMRPTNVGLVVKEALKLLRASLPSTIEIRKDIQTLMAVADATQIHQVIVNLCTNAAHAMSGRGTLEVSLTEVGLSEQDLSALSLSSLNPDPTSN